MVVSTLSDSSVRLESDDVEFNCGRFKVRSDFSSTEFVFTNRAFEFIVTIAVFGKTVCKSRRRI